MKKKVLTIVCCLCAILTTNIEANAQATMIHYWHFNNNTQGAMYTPSISPIPVDYTRITSSVASVLYTGIYGPAGNWNSYIDTLTADLAGADYDTVNLRMSQPEGQVIRARNPSDSMALLFYIPTTHYSNILLTYATQSSSTASGMLHQNFSYSVDNGTTWVTSGTGLSEWTDSAWTTFKRVSVRFADPLANNNPKLVFRITFTGNTHPTGAKGNNRFDNISVDADSITSTLSVTPETVQSQEYIISPNPVTNTLNISSNIAGTNTIAIYNAMGQLIFTSVANEKNTSISTAGFASGSYLLSIRSNTGAVKTIKFVKQ